MARYRQNLSESWPDWLALILGAWLFISPWALGFAGVALWNALLLGAVIAVMTMASLMEWHPWEEWVEVVAGLWLVLSPWLLGFAGAAEAGLTVAAWNAVLVGLAIAGLAALSMWRHHDSGLGAY